MVYVSLIGSNAAGFTLRAMAPSGFEMATLKGGFSEIEASVFISDTKWFALTADWWMLELTLYSLLSHSISYPYSRHRWNLVQ